MFDKYENKTLLLSKEKSNKKSDTVKTEKKIRYSDIRIHVSNKQLHAAIIDMLASMSRHQTQYHIIKGKLNNNLFFYK